MTKSFRDRPLLALLFIGLVILIGGLRFSDGGALLKIASGSSVGNFISFESQFIWDSPLKVSVLRAIGPHLAVISLIFLMLSAMPIALAYQKPGRLSGAFVIALLFTPLIKILFQNVGIGDGVIVTASLVILCAVNPAALIVATAILCLWHPQQSFFAIIGTIMARHLLGGRVRDRSTLIILGTAVVAALLYVGYRVFLIPPFADRMAWVSKAWDGYLRENILFAPLSFAVLILWSIFFWPELRKSWRMTVPWFVLCGAMAIFTTDVSRVLTLITLPLVVAISHNGLASGSVSTRRAMILTGIVAILPIYSWSGVDIFLWQDLIGDLCKWHFVCLAR